MDINCFKEIEVEDFLVEVEATFDVSYDEIESLGGIRLTPGQGDLPVNIQTEAVAKNPRTVFSDEEILDFADEELLAFADKVKEKEAKRLRTIYYSFPTNGTVHQSATHKRVVVLNAQTKVGFAVHRFLDIGHAYQTDTVWNECEMKYFRERDQACRVFRDTAEKIIGRKSLRAHVKTLHTSV